MSSTSTRNSSTGKSASKAKGKAAASSAKDGTWRSNTSAESGKSRGRSSFTTKASTRVRSPASTGGPGRDEAARSGVAGEQRRAGLVHMISAAVAQRTVAAVNSLFHRPARRSILGPPRSEQPGTMRSKKTSVPQPNEGGDSQPRQRQSRFVSKLPRRARADSIRPDARERATSGAKVFPGIRWRSNLSPTSAASSSSGTSAGIPSPPTDVLQRPSQSSSNTSGANPADVIPGTSPANDAEANVRQQDLEVAERTEGKVGAPILPTVPTDNVVADPASDSPAILSETPQVKNGTALFDPLSQPQLAGSKPPGQRLAALLSPSLRRPLSSPVSTSSLIVPDPEVRPTLSVSLRPDAFGMYSPSSSTAASKAAESERAAVDARRLPKWKAMVQREVACPLERTGAAEDTAFSWPASDEQGGMLRVSNKILSAMRIPRRVALDRVFVFARSEKFAKRICKGTPNAWRGHVWYYLFTAMGTSSEVGAEDQLDVTLIQEYYARQSSECIYAEEIELEAQSALSGHAMFAARDGPGQSGIRRILNAFTQRDPEFGFNAAMVKIVAMLLLYMEEERAYVALLHLYNVAPTISGRFGLRNLHVSGFPGLPEMLFLHDELMGIYAPRLKVKLESLNLKTIQYAAHWYLSLFSDCTPTPGLLELDNIAAELDRVLAAAAELSINTGNLTAEMALETCDSLLPFRVLVRLWDLYALHETSATLTGTASAAAKAATAAAMALLGDGTSGFAASAETAVPGPGPFGLGGVTTVTVPVPPVWDPAMDEPFFQLVLGIWNGSSAALKSSQPTPSPRPHANSAASTGNPSPWGRPQTPTGAAAGARKWGRAAGSSAAASAVGRRAAAGSPAAGGEPLPRASTPGGGGAWGWDRRAAGGARELVPRMRIAYAGGEMRL
ncbi:hypothetical protein HK405_004639, partial [Cladochytrium tenue]